MAVARAGRLSSWRRWGPGAQRLAVRLGWPAIAPGLVSFSVVVSLGLAQGGTFPRSWRLTAFALWALAAAALLARERVVIGRLEWLGIAALAGFTAWIALSAIWSERPSSALLNAERSLTYVAAIFAVCVLVERSSLAHLLAGALAAITVLAGFGLAHKLLTSPPLDPVQGDLLFQPIGYANALGALATVGILLSLGLALHARARAARAVVLVPLVVLLPALYLTESRGAWMALVAGVAVVVAFATGAPRRLKAVALGAAAVTAVLAIVLTGGARPDQLAGENRVHYWRVAWNEFVANPVLGSGAGTYIDYWWKNRPNDTFARSAHSLYLQSLAELGPVGLALVVIALGLPLLILVRRRDALAVAAGSAYLAFVLHAGVDWDWELPAVPVAGIVCGGALLVAARPAQARALTLRRRVALALPVLGLAAFACYRLATGSTLPY